jgi:hypothetical protein
MSITLDLSPDTEARLMAEAAARGISVEELLKTTIDTLLTTSEFSSQPVLTPQENADRFVQWARQTKPSENWVELLDAFTNNPALAGVPPLSDEAISHESIYREREDSQL